MASFQWSTIASPQSESVAFPVTVTAKDANGYAATSFNGPVTLSGRAGAGSTITQVLLFQDSNNDYFQSALSALGVKYTAYSSESSFETALGAANPQTTAAIVDCAGDIFAFAAVSSLVSAGGEAILSYWDLGAYASLAAQFGATVASSFETPLPVYDWGGSTLFTGATSPLGFAHTSWTINGTLLQPTASGTAVAGFQSAAAGNEAAVIVANSNRTILDGFLLDDAVSSPQIVQFAENEIQALMNAASPPVAISPVTATLVNGTWTGSVAVSQTEAGMCLQAVAGSGQAGTSNSFTVVPLPPMILTVPPNITEGDPVVMGTVAIPAALDSDLLVSLASSDTSRLTLPASVTIPAGQTSVAVPITTIDTGLLDGPEAVGVTATASGYLSRTGYDRRPRRRDGDAEREPAGQRPGERRHGDRHGNLQRGAVAEHHRGLDLQRHDPPDRARPRSRCRPGRRA